MGNIQGSKVAKRVFHRSFWNISGLFIDCDGDISVRSPCL